MLNVRMLSLPSELLYTTLVALDYRRGVLEATGDTSDYRPKLTKIVSAIDQHQAEMITIDSWTRDQTMHTAYTMECFGGHFATDLAKAFYHADSFNRERLIAAFPEIFIKYGPGGDFYSEPVNG